MVCGICAKIILVTVNIVFVLAGLGLFLAGMILKHAWDAVFSNFLNPLLEGINAAGQAANSGIEQVDTSQFDFTALIGGPAIAAISVGVVIMAIAMVGCCSACYQIRVVLIIYGVFLIVLFVAELVIVIVLFAATAEVQKIVKDPLRNSIKESYAGYDGTDGVTLAWNMAMYNAKCCGVDDYTDFTDAVNWNTTFTIESLSTDVTLMTPVPCCKLDGTFPQVSQPADYTCASTPTDVTSNWKKGCYAAVGDILLGYEGTYIALGVIICLFQLLLIIMTFILACEEPSFIGVI